MFSNLRSVVAPISCSSFEGVPAKGSPMPKSVIARTEDDTELGEEDQSAPPSPPLPVDSDEE
ncbi:hypothetical protein LR48_Vigan01g172500 [Vigna angularis]|uniref:Uncharacterized protein n=1 Tax=Phaseolus angularis TaxID=3914 RepID=A0A0L9TPS4_PHAAN|nr:hypothetical protein LR48_Vigan01g172500 [Vigna angularis]